MTSPIFIATWATAIKDGEAKTSAGGNQYGVVVLAADSGQTSDDGKPVPTFLKCFAFGGLAAVAANLRKGGRA